MNTPYEQKLIRIKKINIKDTGVINAAIMETFRPQCSCSGVKRPKSDSQIGRDKEAKCWGMNISGLSLYPIRKKTDVCSARLHSKVPFKTLSCFSENSIVAIKHGHQLNMTTL